LHICKVFLLKVSSTLEILRAVTDLSSFVSLTSPSENIFTGNTSGFTDTEDAVQYHTVCCSSYFRTLK